MNADIAARVRILDDDDCDDALARLFVLFFQNKRAFRFVSNSARGNYSRVFSSFLSLIFQKSLSSLLSSLSLRALV
jgi:hypothetical protein